MTETADVEDRKTATGNKLRAAIDAFNSAAREAADLGLRVELEHLDLRRTDLPFPVPVLSVEIYERR